MKTLQIIMMLLFVTSLNSQTLPDNPIHTQAGTVNAFTKVEPPAIFLYRNELNTASTATFQIEAPDSPDSVKIAINYAAKIWSYLIRSNQPIKIRVWWKTLEQGALGVTDSLQYFINFTNTLKQNVFYPTSLAEALSNQNLNETKPEFVISLNKNMQWYCDTVGDCPANKYDLVTVMMHEIGHGLGGLPSFDVNQSGFGSWGLDYGTVKRPTIYDTACVVGQYPTSIYILTKTSEYPNPSLNLGSALKNNNIYFDGPNVYSINNNELPKLYAPSPWAGGSSISHLDESSYPHGNSNSLMTPTNDYAEAIHSPGEIGLAMMQDLGWNINRIVTFTYPQGSERWAQGETYQIKWTDNNYGSVLIKLYRKNELYGTFDEVLTLGGFPSYTGTTNTQNWTVPTTLINGIYRLQVSMFSGEGIGLSNVFTISNQVASPTFSPLGGIYVDPQSVYISCSTPGATIYYTDNGSTPSQSSIQYTNTPIYIDADKTLKAIAYKTGFQQSEVSSATYIIGTTGGNLLAIGPNRRDDHRGVIQYLHNDTGSAQYDLPPDFRTRRKDSILQKRKNQKWNRNKSSEEDLINNSRWKQSV